MTSKGTLKERINSLIDPTSHMARIRYYVNPRPLDPTSPNVFYKSVLSKYNLHDQDVCVPSKECADKSIMQAGEVVLPEPE